LKTAGTLIVVIVIIVAIFFSSAFAVFYLKNNPAASSQATPTPAPSQGGDNYYYYQNPTPAPSSSGTGTAPTGTITVNVEPSPLMVGGYASFNVVSNGKDYPVTGYGKHVGAGVTQTMDGRLTEQGRFYYGQTINLAGYWDFWAVSGGITSNVFRLQVQGCSFSMAEDRFSRMMGNMKTTVQLFSHFTGNAQVFATNEATGVVTNVAVIRINSGGYGSGEVDFSGMSLGNYMLDFSIGGIKASDYGNDVWFNLGR
jgi:hypothetical protein